MSEPAILIVIHDFALGGTERIAVRLGNAWADRGARVTILAGTLDGPLRELVGAGVTVVAADPPVPRARRTRAALGRAARAYALAVPHDVAFIPGNYHWPVAAALGSVLPVVAQVSAALTKPQRGWIAQWRFEHRMRALLRTAAAVVTLSPEHRARARRILGDDRAIVIPLPALGERKGELSPVPPGPPRVVAVGRLVREKGFDLLIDAFARLPGTDALLTIVGDGPERERLAAQARARGIAERVELTGYIADPAPYVRSARVVALPSRHEGFPAVVVEALAAGRQVVATDCTPATGIVRSAGGMVVPIDDADALSAALATVLASSPPPPATVAAVAAPYRVGPVSVAYLTLFRRFAR